MVDEQEDAERLLKLEVILPHEARLLATASREVLDQRLVEVPAVFDLLTEHHAGAGQVGDLGGVVLELRRDQQILDGLLAVAVEAVQQRRLRGRLAVGPRAEPYRQRLLQHGVDQRAAEVALHLATHIGFGQAALEVTLPGAGRVLVRVLPAAQARAHQLRVVCCERTRAQVHHAVRAVEQVGAAVPLGELGMKAALALEERKASRHALVPARGRVQGLQALVFGVPAVLGEAVGVVAPQHLLRGRHDDGLGSLMPDAPVPESPHALVRRPPVAVAPRLGQHGRVGGLVHERVGVAGFARGLVGALGSEAAHRARDVAQPGRRGDQLVGGVEVTHHGRCRSSFPHRARLSAASQRSSAAQMSVRRSSSASHSATSRSYTASLGTLSTVSLRYRRRAWSS